MYIYIYLFTILIFPFQALLFYYDWIWDLFPRVRLCTIIKTNVSPKSRVSRIQENKFDQPYHYEYFIISINEFNRIIKKKLLYKIGKNLCKLNMTMQFRVRRNSIRMEIGLRSGNKWWFEVNSFQ